MKRRIEAARVETTGGKSTRGMKEVKAVSG